MLSNEENQLSPKSVRSISGVMSKIIPVKEPKYYASRRHEHAEVCPRLEKWMEKANSGGFAPAKRNNKKVLQAATKSRRYLGMFTSSKRKRTPGSLRGSPNRRRLSSKRFRESGKRNGNASPRKSPRKPIRAKTIFNNIRQKSRNFGIRCKTSVSLWKQWIVNGIKWDKQNSLNFPKLRSKSSVNDIDNITKSKRTKSELDGYSSNSVISEIIDEVDEPPDNNHRNNNKNNTAVKSPEVSKVKKFLGIFRVNKLKESPPISSAKQQQLSPVNKFINSPTSERLDVLHEEESDCHEEDYDVADDDDEDNVDNNNNNSKNKNIHNNIHYNNHRDKIPREDDQDKNNNQNKSRNNNNNNSNNHRHHHNSEVDDNDDIQDYEEVDDVTISDRDLTSNKNFHPMQKLAQIDTEKIENIDRSSNHLKQTEDDEYYDDDIYYDHHLNGYYRTEADPIGDEILRQKAKNKNGAIHRAFNKLKLFF